MYRQGLDQAERILQGIDVGVAPPGKLTLMQGQKVRMTVGFNYRGTALTCTLRCSIGSRILLVFNEHVWNEQAVSIPQSVDFVAYTAFADILCGATDVGKGKIDPGSNYDIEAKIKEYSGQTLVKIDNVIDIIGTPEFTGFAIIDYSVA